MGREVRMVPADWEHPRYSEDEVAARPYLAGRYKPLFESSFSLAASEWDENNKLWQNGLRKNWVTGELVPNSDRSEFPNYSDYAGERPVEEDYMPDWPDAERTHLMMYETTSKGTPISPAFATPEELAEWLAKSGASAFGSSTATYEQWLSTCKRGWACSGVIKNGHVVSGVEALSG